LLRDDLQVLNSGTCFDLAKFKQNISNDIKKECTKAMLGWARSLIEACERAPPSSHSSPLEQPRGRNSTTVPQSKYSSMSLQSSDSTISPQSTTAGTSPESTRRHHLPTLPGTIDEPDTCIPSIRTYFYDDPYANSPCQKYKIGTPRDTPRETEMESNYELSTLRWLGWPPTLFSVETEKDDS